MSTTFDLDSNPHRRLNILTGEWVLVSPHRTKRPWQGKVEDVTADNRPEYDPKCYLCPGNDRADGDVNPDYKESFVFKNDFSALLEDTPAAGMNDDGLLVAQNERGICKVISFSPKHNLTLPELSVSEITAVVDLWQKEFNSLSENEWIKYIQIFENKGEIMGCSNPHPHGQIWSQSEVPMEIVKETERQKNYYAVHRESLLSAYLKIELKKNERIVYENEHFVVLVPFWAVWPYETMIISKRQVNSIKYFNGVEKAALADAIKMLTIKYDNLFETSFPYSAGMHQAPVNGGDHPEWHWHMHFYPPLLRSATVKKFMVGYEMLANPQRDITPEFAANRLKELSTEHYKLKLTK
ncbi:UDPglucose--hexose-1-phosphate uridylyltransferase [Pedobacter psychrotolerans]|uniref:Galactose-1-phosphate uridylyltransferase n=1 Tax=Pedobacter psychrotolerans TaxID=1843235 RepID=A0A4V2RYR6_9SPHI|nr:UDP-glucose--hexose-1-phosphate uridylyltransferase [Pedobacter psychrotolerans]TCO21586.1 UDPglucose--hexose-1-phosphate uridylyltransferase [Pedobacter psychrotolerans]GGE39671.1 galactose-1-phosphate uridylyltransferase [Pedobacter psychrotolerans]